MEMATEQARSGHTANSFKNMSHPCVVGQSLNYEKECGMQNKLIKLQPINDATFLQGFTYGIKDSFYAITVTLSISQA